MAETTAANGDSRDLEADAPPAQPSVLQRWNQPVNTKYTDLICLLLCMNTGLCDSAAYNAWSCFLAMQTGTFKNALVNHHLTLRQETPSSSVWEPPGSRRGSHGAG